MRSNVESLRTLVRRQLLLLWVAVAVAWAYAFTLVGEASWNLGWTVLLWGLFTLLFAVVGVRTVALTESIQDRLDERLTTLEERIDDLETDATD